MHIHLSRNARSLLSLTVLQLSQLDTAAAVAQHDPKERGLEVCPWIGQRECALLLSLQRGASDHDSLRVTYLPVYIYGERSWSLHARRRPKFQL